MPIRVVAFDGDDTLWHNEGRFKLTQTALRDASRRPSAAGPFCRGLLD
jgi:hypothetical protein